MHDVRMEFVVLVDENDTPIGEMEKLEAHQKGKLHRAFSVFILNRQNELLIHRRAIDKYHSGGLWTNTCCSHPRPGEDIIEAGNRRLREEMGIDAMLDHLFSFMYKAEFANGLTEHELDHVLVGHSDSLPTPNPNEVMDWKFISPEELLTEINKNPDNYTVWFREILERFLDHIHLI